MSEDIPPPLTPRECDCTDLDGFMLNVERLMASELVALSSHEIVAASLFLWCRAWKQRPAASLPDDDRVNAAFARLPLARFKRLKREVMHGFVKCNDGRLYHRVLAAEALNAYQRKLSFQKRRNDDAERLRKWREKHGETRVEREGQDKDSTGQGQNRKEFFARTLRTARLDSFRALGRLRRDAQENPCAVDRASAGAGRRRTRAPAPRRRRSRGRAQPIRFPGLERIVSRETRRGKPWCNTQRRSCCVPRRRRSLRC